MIIYISTNAIIPTEKEIQIGNSPLHCGGLDHLHTVLDKGIINIRIPKIIDPIIFFLVDLKFICI